MCYVHVCVTSLGLYAEMRDHFGSSVETWKGNKMFLVNTLARIIGYL